jgi:type II secretory ATPase GspE/PulE/Tfp pilus assembly ATPase PilB-like protein
MRHPRDESGLHDVSPLVDDLLHRGLAAGATDVHFEPVGEGLLVRVRVDGHLADLELLSSRLSENVVSRLKVLSSLLTYRIDIPQEGSFLWRDRTEASDNHEVELRVATFPTIRGERAVVRVFHKTPVLQSIESVGFDEDQVKQIRAAVAQPAGFIVVSGPAGSGKTTTLYMMVRDVQDRFPGRSIITLEDPVEQRLDRVAQIQINPYGELDYERCMRSVLRHDPQVILLGEVRDRQTALIAVEAALTGHLILTSVHSGDPAETIVRFLEMGIPSYQLASALTLICSQRLLRLRCTRCREARRPGCDACLETGYSGRTAVGQTAVLDEPTRALLLAHSPASVLREELKKQGPDLTARAAALVAQGVTDEDEVGRVLGYHASP